MHLDESNDREPYLFGDSDLAARRLQLLAHVFEPSTREFLARFAPLDLRAVLDVGCGPGHTTRLLAELFPHARVVGIDNSPRFIELARARAVGRQPRFEVADATRLLPAGPYNLIYCRYVLTHLAEPAAAVTRWSRSLQPGGAIAVEENDSIEASEPAFTKYLGIVAAMLADQGQKLYVGQELDRFATGPPLVRAASERVPIGASDRDAATMFAMNIRGWRHQSFVERQYSQAELDALEQRLDELARDASQRSSITFVRRRLVFIRAES